MIERDYFSHTIPGYGKVWDKLDAIGYCYKVAGENIGWNNYPDDIATAAIHQMFMDSSGHRGNILGKAWDVIGIGAYKGPTGKKMWTVLFADKCGTTSSRAKPTPKPTAKRRRRRPKPTPSPPRSRRPTDAQADAQADPGKPTPPPPDRPPGRRSLGPGAPTRASLRPNHADEPPAGRDRRARPPGAEAPSGMRVVDRVDRRPARDDRRRSHRILLRRLTWPSLTRPAHHARRPDRTGAVGTRTPARYTAARCRPSSRHAT